MIRKNYAMAVAVCATLAMLPVPGTAKADSLKDKLDNLQISGFVDGSVYGDNTKNTAGQKTWGSGLDQVELDVSYTKGNVGLRFDLNVFPSSTSTVTNDTLMEQGYMTYTIPSLLDKGLTFTFGKFNAPIGWELLDPTDMYQYSHSDTFALALPTNLIGFMASGSYGMVDASLYYANHADSNGTQLGGMKTVGGRIGITPMDGANIGFSYLHDSSGNGVGSAAKVIYDIDATYTGVSGLTLGGEYNEGTGWQGLTGGTQIKSKSWFVTAHYDINDTFGVTGRYEHFNGDISTSGASTDYTGAVTAALGDGAGCLVEVRQDKNTKATAHTNANGVSVAANSKVTSYAFEMTYAF